MAYPASALAAALHLARQHAGSRDGWSWQRE